MALLDIVTTDEENVTYFSRGNIGVLLDAVSSNTNSILIPEVTGGGGESLTVYASVS